MVLKDLFLGMTIVGILMTLFHKKFPKIAAWGIPIGLIGLLGVYYIN